MHEECQSMAELPQRVTDAERISVQKSWEKGKTFIQRVCADYCDVN